MAPIFLQEAVA